MPKNTTTLLLIAAAAAAGFYFFTRKAGGQGVQGMSEAEAAMRIAQEQTEQKKLELEYMKQQGEQSWEDVFKTGVGSVVEGGGKALGSWLGSIV